MGSSDAERTACVAPRSATKGNLFACTDRSGAFFRRCTNSGQCLRPKASPDQYSISPGLVWFCHFSLLVGAPTASDAPQHHQAQSFRHHSLHSAPQWPVDAPSHQHLHRRRQTQTRRRRRHCGSCRQKQVGLHATQRGQAQSPRLKMECRSCCPPRV